MFLRVILLSCLMVLSPWGAADPVSTKRVVASSGGAPFMEVELDFDGSKAGFNLPLLSSGNGNVEDLLSTYYAAAVQNDVPAIRQLQYVDDGSRQQFEKEIQEIPSKYENFYKVDKVLLGEKYLWGNYTAVSIEWYSNGAHLADWVELVYCEQACFMSDLLFSGGAGFDMFSGLVSLFRSSPASAQGMNDGTLIELYPNEQNIGSAARYRYKLDLSDDNLIERQEEGPATVTGELPPDASPLVSFVHDVWSLPATFFSDLSSASAQDKNDAMQALYGPSYHEFAVDAMLPMYGKDNATGETLETYFAPLAFARLVDGWQSFEVVGVLRAQEAVFVFVDALSGQSGHLMQVFSVSKDGDDWLVDSESEARGVHEILMSPSFISSFQETHMGE